MIRESDFKERCRQPEKRGVWGPLKPLTSLRLFGPGCCARIAQRASYACWSPL